MKNLLKLIQPFFILLIIVSCKETEMSTHDINEAQISGIATSYEAVYKSDELVINPQIIFTQDERQSSAYTFSWKAIPVSTPNAAGTLISNERNLKQQIDLPPGDYNLYYRIVDNNTNVAFTKSTQLKVTTAVGRGFLVFGDDKAGYADLQMIAIKASGEELILKKLLANNGLPPLKGALQVYYSGSLPAYYVDNKKLWIMTNDGSYYIDGTTFQSDEVQTLKSLSYFSFLPSDAIHPIEFAPVSINGVQTTGARVAIWSNGYFNKNENVARTFPESYGDWINHQSNVFVKLAPYLAYSPLTTSSSFIVFDKDNKRFKYNSNYYYELVNLTSATTYFPWDQAATQRDLVYMESTVNTEGGAVSGNAYALMKDPSGKLFIYKFYPRTRIQVGFYQPSLNIATDLDKAKFYAFYSNRSYLFYTVGNKLYGYEFNAGNEKLRLIKDFGTDEITMLKFDIQNTNTAGNHLYVATYNETSGGTLRRFTVDNNPNDVIATETKSWSGLNKIKSIYWRND